MSVLTYERPAKVHTIDGYDGRGFIYGHAWMQHVTSGALPAEIVGLVVNRTVVARRQLYAINGRIC